MARAQVLQMVHKDPCTGVNRHHGPGWRCSNGPCKGVVRNARGPLQWCSHGLDHGAQVLLAAVGGEVKWCTGPLLGPLLAGRCKGEVLLVRTWCGLGGEWCTFYHLGAFAVGGDLVHVPWCTGPVGGRLAVHLLRGEPGWREMGGAQSWPPNGARLHQLRVGGVLLVGGMGYLCTFYHLGAVGGLLAVRWCPLGGFSAGISAGNGKKVHQSHLREFGWRAVHGDAGRRNIIVHPPRRRGKLAGIVHHLTCWQEMARVHIFLQVPRWGSGAGILFAGRGKR